MKYLVVIVTLLFSITSYGQDLIYTPKNPAFGGNFLNYNWLLNSANAQNTFTDPATEEGDLISDFEETFNQTILNQLTRDLFQTDDIFGEEGIAPGTFEIGNLILDVVPGLNGLIITITDISSGSQTQITVPYF